MMFHSEVIGYLAIISEKELNIYANVSLILHRLMQRVLKDVISRNQYHMLQNSAS